MPVRIRLIPFAIYPGGVRWTGHWLIEGDVLVVRSAYGSRECRLGRRKPARLAEELMLEILAAKLAALESETAAQA